MMPLSMLRIANNVTLKEIRASQSIKKALLERGLVTDTKIQVIVSDMDGSYVLLYGNTRLAVDKHLASFILVSPDEGGLAG
ncbi:hypothetical protein BHU72_06410 [Desulfuribacillus stibiiarsenatis]|uniref:Ferrous iron transporter FeoA-like domain-containing protein n=1 Tax=Desulfuribacillus stibiiarsenatis TaxID=1390249 RepID=A0A1E5L5F3_9FIRM|nr:FeoA family protein [Desulfuribacillus stibiiarsenatis]OEH85233.1 hypothetical protein BHU72_06410 [Desulfuribacillus stibiiarsenatis]